MTVIACDTNLARPTCESYDDAFARAYTKGVPDALTAVRDMLDDLASTNVWSAVGRPDLRVQVHAEFSAAADGTLTNNDCLTVSVSLGTGAAIAHPGVNYLSELSHSAYSSDLLDSGYGALVAVTETVNDILARAAKAL